MMRELPLPGEKSLRCNIYEQKIFICSHRNVVGEPFHSREDFDIESINWPVPIHFVKLMISAGTALTLSGQSIAHKTRHIRFACYWWRFAVKPIGLLCPSSPLAWLHSPMRYISAERYSLLGHCVAGLGA